MTVITGYGVFTTQEFRPGDFLLDYRGELIPFEEANKRSDNEYLYFFQYGGLEYW